MTEAVAVDPATLRLTFSGKQSARTILDVVDIPDRVEGLFTTANPFDGSQMKPPLGSGPYKVGRVVAGPDDRI